MFGMSGQLAEEIGQRGPIELDEDLARPPASV